MDIYCIHCNACEFRQEFTLESLLQWLRPHGLFRRSTPADFPDSSAVLSVARSGLSRISCPACSKEKLGIQLLEEESDSSWNSCKPCESCGRPIEEERLEALPLSKICMACAKQGGSKSAQALDEFCPRCGDRLTVRGSSSGISRYSLYCKTCRK